MQAVIIGIEISKDLSPIEQRVGAACAVAKWNMGVEEYIVMVIYG